MVAMAEEAARKEAKAKAKTRREYLAIVASSVKAAGEAIRSMGLAPGNAPTLNAALMADSIWSRRDRDYRAGTPPRRPDRLPDSDADMLKLFASGAPAEALLRKQAAEWVDEVEAIELHNASCVRVLIWAVELYGYADPEGTSDLATRRAEAADFCRVQFRIDASNPPPEYFATVGPWGLVKRMRRYDICSRSIRAREMVEAASGEALGW